MNRPLGNMPWRVPPLGLSLRAARTRLLCGEFGSTIERLLGEAIATGCELSWLDIPPARDDIATGSSTGPFDAATADLWKWLGAAIRAARADDHFVATAALASVTSGDLRIAFPLEFVQHRVEQILVASTLEVVPCVQLQLEPEHHRNDHHWSELRETMLRLVREGKVLHWGVAVAAPPRVVPVDRNRDPEDDSPPSDDFPDLARDDVMSSLSVPYHLFGQNPARWFATAAQLKLAVVATEPLCSGALAGEIGASTLFHRFDPRALRWTPADLQRMAVSVARLAQCVKQVPLAANSCEDARAVVGQWQQARTNKQAVEPLVTSLLELALRFVLSTTPGVTVVGACSSAQWLAAHLAADPRPLDTALVASLVQ